MLYRTHLPNLLGVFFNSAITRESAHARDIEDSASSPCFRVPVEIIERQMSRGRGTREHENVGQAPWPARVPLDPLVPEKAGRGGPVADQGVRPTTACARRR